MHVSSIHIEAVVGNCSTNAFSEESIQQIQCTINQLTPEPTRVKETNSFNFFVLGLLIVKEFLVQLSRFKEMLPWSRAVWGRDTWIVYNWISELYEPKIIVKSSLQYTVLRIPL